MLGKRFIEAFQYACELHAAQVRKGTEIPYIAHLMAVAAIVLENGGNEDQTVAALLHDAVEDQGGERVLQNITKRFGPSVADIVAGCTDAWTQPKPPWKDRKKRYIAKIAEESSEVLLVSLADKLQNVLSILRDYRHVGEALWDRFTGGKEGTLWYYHNLVEAFEKRGESSLMKEFRETVAELENCVGKAD